MAGKWRFQPSRSLPQLEQAKDRLRNLKKDRRLAKKMAMEWYIKTLIIEHFNFGNTQKYGYTPLTEKYKLAKIRKHGLLPDLVLTGALKAAVLRGKVRFVGDSVRMVFNLPGYGKVQIQLGRDFITPSPEEEILIRKKYLEFLRKIRASRVANNK